MSAGSWNLAIVAEEVEERVRAELYPDLSSKRDVMNKDLLKFKFFPKKYAADVVYETLYSNSMPFITVLWKNGRNLFYEKLS